MAYDIFDTTEDNAKLKIVGLGAGGCKAIDHLMEHGDYEGCGISYTAIHNQSDLISENNAEHTILIDQQKQSADEDNNKIFNQSLSDSIGDQFADIDAFFILADFRDSENIKLASSLGKVFINKDLLKHGFIVAIINQPAQYEGKELQQQFEQGKQALLKYCDTVIVNSSEMILRDLNKNNKPVTDYFNQEFEANYQSIQIFIHTIVYVGLICVDFSDVYAVVADMSEAIRLSAMESGDDRAIQAINKVLKEAEQEWGSLFNPEIEAVLVDICAADMDLSEFDQIGDIICYAFSGSVRIKIATALDDKLKDQMEVNVLVVKRKK